MDEDVQLAITQQLQHIRLTPTGAERLYPRRTPGTRSILTCYAPTPQASTQQDTHTQEQDKGAAPLTGSEEPACAEQTMKQARTQRRNNQWSPYDEGEAGKDDLGTEAAERMRDSHREEAAKGHAAAGNKRRDRNMDEAEQRDELDRTLRTHEENTGGQMVEWRTAMKVDDSEPHMAAHTTRTAHPAKRAEKHTRDDEDGGRRQRTRRESDTKNVTAPGAAQPCASISVEPSGAASNPYRNRETIKISTEAKSQFIQKGNFYDFGMEKKRERDPG